MSEKLPPIARTVSVSWAPAEAYRRFVEDFARWWPRAPHWRAMRRRTGSAR